MNGGHKGMEPVFLRVYLCVYLALCVCVDSYIWYEVRVHFGLDYFVFKLLMNFSAQAERNVSSIILLQSLSLQVAFDYFIIIFFLRKMQ